MTIQELIDEANNKMKEWEKKLPEGMSYGIWYEREDFEAWVEKAMDYLDANYKEAPQTTHFHKLYTNENERKDYHRHIYFKEMINCLEELAKKEQ